MKHFIILNLTSYFLLLTFSCSEQHEHTAPAVLDRDSVPTMTSFGVNTLISDSGVMRYRIVAERWEVNERLSDPRWNFRRGLFLEQFDEHFHPEAHIQADTAQYFTNRKLWHLWGNVRLHTVDGVTFNSEELYWDQNRHELYSNLYSHVRSPERELEGTTFTSDEQMRHYTVAQSKGNFRNAPATANTTASPVATTDTTPKRQPATPRHH